MATFSALCQTLECVPRLPGQRRSPRTWRRCLRSGVLLGPRRAALLPDRRLLRRGGAFSREGVRGGRHGRARARSALKATTGAGIPIQPFESEFLFFFAFFFIPYSRALQVEGLMAGLVAAVVAPVGAVVAQLIAALSMETSTEEDSPAVRVRCAFRPLYQLAG